MDRDEYFRKAGELASKTQAAREAAERYFATLKKVSPRPWAAVDLSKLTELENEFNTALHEYSEFCIHNRQQLV